MFKVTFEECKAQNNKHASNVVKERDDICQGQK